MNQYDACEQSYKNGYDKGYADGIKFQENNKRKNNSNIIRLRDFIDSLDNQGYKIVLINDNNIIYNGEAKYIELCEKNYRKYFIDKINISNNNSIYIYVIKD